MSNSGARCAMVAQYKPGTRTAAAEKNGQGQKQSRQACLLPAVTAGQSQISSGERHAIPTHGPCWTAKSQSPKMSQSLLNLKLNGFQLGTQRGLGKGSVSSLRKSVAMPTAFLRRRIPLEMPRYKSACIPVGVPEHHHHQAYCLAW